MIIRPSDFENEGVVDCTAHYRARGDRRTGRLSIRKSTRGTEYEVFVTWHGSKSEDVLLEGPLHECVFFTNKVTGGMDSVAEA